MKVSVVYARPERQLVLEIDCPAGTTAREAVLTSAMDQYFEDLDLESIPIGIYGEKVADDHPLREFDRIELYRPLLMDPMEARRERARETNRKTKSKTSRKKQD